jgi:hypothetical protein
LTVIGVASLRHRVTALAASSARPSPFLPEDKRSAAPTAVPSNAPADRVRASPVSSSASISVPIVQLEQLPATAEVARPKSVVSGAKPVSAKSSRPERSSAAPVDCDPPYRIDASGVRRVRFECL